MQRDRPQPRSGNGAGSTLTCYNCGETGHGKRECTNFLKEGVGSRGGGSTLKCYNCGEAGHSRKECTNPAKEGQDTRACHTCGQTGHLQHDCPEKSSCFGGVAREEEDINLVVMTTKAITPWLLLSRMLIIRDLRRNGVTTMELMTLETLQDQSMAMPTTTKGFARSLASVRMTSGTRTAWRLLVGAGASLAAVVATAMSTSKGTRMRF